MLRNLRWLVAFALGTALTGQNWEGRNGPGLTTRVAAALEPGGGVVQFGGSTSGGLLPSSYYEAPHAIAWTWRYDATGWQQLQPAARPPALYSPMTCYDSVRNRTVMFGGLPIGLQQVMPETWEWDGTTWSQVFSNQTPTAGVFGSLAFDAGRGVVVLHGGFGPVASTASTETWEFDGQQWQQVVTANAPQQIAWAGRAMSYSPVLGQVVRVIYSPQGVETWHYDGVDWTQNTAVTGALSNASFLTVEPGGVLMAVHRSGTSPLQTETWRYDGVSWQQAVTANTPTIKVGNWMVHDPIRDVVLYAQEDEVWCYDGVDWTLESPSTMQRTGASALAFDSGRGRAIMFGGSKDGSAGGVLATNEHWEWDGTKWLQRTFATMPSPRNEAFACYDRARGRTVVCHGFLAPPGSQTSNEVWEFDGQSWTLAGTIPPAAMNMVALTYDAGRRMCVALTYDQTWPSYSHSLWTYDGSTWTQLPAQTRPPYRQRPVFTYDSARDLLLLYGGGNGSSIHSDTWEYRDGDWTQHFPQVRPPTGATNGTFLPTRGRVVVRSYTDNGLWEFGGAHWHPVPNATPPPDAHGYRVLVDDRNQEMIAIGWYAEVSVWRPDPTPHWASSGFGCAHTASATNQPPELVPAAGSTPSLGSTFTLEVQGLHNPNAPALLLLGQRADQVAGQSLPLPLSGVGLPGCQLWLAPDLIEAAFASASVATFDLALPATPALAGSHLWAQAVEVDPAAPIAVGALSNAGVATLF